MGFLDIFFGNKRVRPDEPAGAQVMTYRAADQTWGPAAAAGGAGAVTRAGGNSTEATTTSTAAVDLLSTASLSLAFPALVQVTWAARKSGGAAANGQLGLKLNTTAVYAATTNGGPARIGSAADAAVSAFCTWSFYVNVPTYLRGGMLLGASPSSNASGIDPLPTDMPAATITDVLGQALSNNALVTVGFDEQQIYSFSTS